MESTMLYKNCSISKTGIVFTVYCGKNLIDFINNHDVQGQQLINIAVSKSMQNTSKAEAKPQ
jgi:hypothetical protein